MDKSKTVGIDCYQSYKTCRGKLSCYILLYFWEYAFHGVFLFHPTFYFLFFFVMTVSKARKSETLAELKADLTRATSFALVQSNRITVAEVSKVRRWLLPVSGKMTVAKKTLIQIAAKEIKGVDIPESMLPGQVAIVMAFDDAVAPLSVVNTLAKEFEGVDKLVFTGSYLDGALQDAQTTKKLASLPSRDVLLAKFMGSLLNPVSSLARFFDGAKQKLQETNKATVGDLATAA